MSAITLESVDFATRNDSEISSWDFVKDVAGNRPYYILQTPKLALDVLITTMGIAGSALNRLSLVCQKAINTENFISLFQDVMIIPAQSSKLARSTIEWIRGEKGALSALNDVRKTLGLYASTLGDFVSSCEALDSIAVSFASSASVKKWSFLSEKVGAAGSAIGSASRIADYALGEFDDTLPAQLTSSQSLLASSLVDSKHMWNLARDVSILAISVLTIGCGGFAAVPVSISIGLSGSILGSRLVAYYREVQIKALEEARPALIVAKKELGGKKV